MRGEIEKPFKDWSLLYMLIYIDELIKKEPFLIWIFQETHQHLAQRVWYHYSVWFWLWIFLVLISLKTQIILSIKNELCSLKVVCLLEPRSAPFWTFLNVSFCLSSPQKSQPVQELHYSLLQMCRERKMISKSLMLLVFSGHWKSNCTFSDNYDFPISLSEFFLLLLVWRCFILAVHRFPDHPWMHCKCYCMYELCNA